MFSYNSLITISWRVQAANFLVKTTAIYEDPLVGITYELGMMDAASMFHEMQSLEVIVGTVGVLLLATLLYTILSAEAERRRMPPGPWAWPIVGNAPLLWKELRHRTLHALASKYGGLMYLRVGT